MGDHLFGLTEAEVMDRFPEVYDHVLHSVKAQRREQFEKSPTSDAKAYLEKWWVFGKPRSFLRPTLAGLPRYIATVETSKFRTFQFLDAEVIPDNMLVVIADDRAETLGILSSRIHTIWSGKAGGTLEDRPRYNKSLCFDPFPFPEASPEKRAAIADIAERLDRCRKDAMAENETLTITEIYNWRDKLPVRASLSRDDRDRMALARAAIVDALHDQLDAAVAEAYGWPGDLAPADIVARLVSLNAERAAEEANGRVRWLRPAYQAPV
jgi:hypothetical protein